MSIYPGEWYLDTAKPVGSIRIRYRIGGVAHGETTLYPDSTHSAAEKARSFLDRLDMRWWREHSVHAKLDILPGGA